MFRQMTLVFMAVIGVTSAPAMSSARLNAAEPLGQAIQKVSTTPGAKQSRTAESGTALIVLDVTNASVRDALSEVAKQGGVYLTYAEATLVRVKPVTVYVAGATLDQAFAAVLKGTRLYVVKVGPGQYGVRAREVARVAQGVISGVVSDAKTGKPISGASVSLGAVSDRGVTTGEDGGYRLSGVANGTHTVTVRIIGYAKQTRQVTVGDGATVTQDFKLDPSASVLDQVIVTGTVVAQERRAVPNAMSVVTGKELEERGITKIDQLFRGEIPGVFSWLTPGGVNNGSNTVSTAVYGGAQVFSRGVTQTSGALILGAPGIKTYVDGVELADASFLNTIDPKSIERIEILTGPQASTVYGSGAISGVMQVFTKKGTQLKKPELLLSLQSGLVESTMSSNLTPQHDYSAQLSGGGEGMSYNIGGGYAYLGAWYPGIFVRTYSGYGAMRRTEERVTAEASARLSRRNLGAGQALGQASTLANTQSGLFTLSPGNLLPNNRRPSVRTRTLGLVTSVELFPWWQQRLTLGMDEANTQLLAEKPNFGAASDTAYTYDPKANNRLTVQTSSNMSHEFSNMLMGTLVAGVDYMKYTTHSSTGSYGTTVGTLAPVGTITIQRDEETNKGYYAQGQLGIKEKLFLTVGLRREDNTNYGKNYKGGWYPRYGASFVQEMGIVTAKFRAAYGAATRTPAAGIGAAVLGTNVDFPIGYLDRLANPNLQPERQHGPEGGLELYFGDRASLQVTNYDQVTGHLITLVLVDSVQASRPGPVTSCTNLRSDGFCYITQFQNQNVGAVRNRGWEGQGELKVMRRLTFGGTWSYTRSRFLHLDPGYRCTSIATNSVTINCFTPGRMFFNVPEHTASTRLTYRDSRSTVNLSVSHVGLRIVPAVIQGGGSPSSYRLRVSAKRFDSFSQAVAADGHRTVDLHALRSVGSRAQLFLNVSNLTDMHPLEFNVSGIEYASIGRQTSLGARITIK